MGVCLAEMEGKHSRCTRKGTLVCNSWASGRIHRPVCSRGKSVRQTGCQENRVLVPALLVRICMITDKSLRPSPSLLPQFPHLCNGNWTTLSPKSVQPGSSPATFQYLVGVYRRWDPLGNTFRFVLVDLGLTLWVPKHLLYCY